MWGYESVIVTVSLYLHDSYIWFSIYVTGYESVFYMIAKDWISMSLQDWITIIQYLHDS